ncbi:hypothetical protein KC640_01870 [Candidatus Dojkabacteria bacterium]|uniref:Uncharacterized protein n=1 Tax=Candidatus Dojkabacteria bacterium TaxID=2099670 RepID=A0A955I650_9BACT|nr:hypothetical protein [Candidatus Dojkabacteria bacterium]
MASDRSIFKFNLLPGKSADDVKMEVKRDNSTFYAVLLVVSASVMYLAIVLIQALLLTPRLRSLTTQLAERQQVEASYGEVQSAYGELFIKTKTLKPVLAKNIDTSEIFRVADGIKGGRADIVIESYSRERTGEFVFLILSPEFVDASELIKNASELTGVSDVEVRTVAVNENTGLVRTTLALNIEAVNG